MDEYPIFVILRALGIIIFLLYAIIKFCPIWLATLLIILLLL